MDKMYVQYGCGLSAPSEWTNFDVSPTLRIQQFPIAGSLLKKRLNTVFPDNVLYGDIIRGLPVADNTCDGLYCSHTLEHLSLDDFRRALTNSYRILKPGGIFRCVVPDLESAARAYIAELDKGNPASSIAFIDTTLLGVKARPTTVRSRISALFGNSHHLWMWDTKSLAEELRKAGFVQIRACRFNDSEDPMFRHVEAADRFEGAAALECRK
ncbi:class I SAM-dependent methyltransferase [uncultured Spirosoma sp.]|uniref:class I SAM-dependent methyltransferase n=1 Tax=uncultured Spirosoma sp. TaxID=278208 RepID=UPI00258A5D21|nr:class I SAM-dependent methyltransferase [uncultured Spirosoma sp.]